MRTFLVKTIGQFNAKLNTLFSQFVNQEISEDTFKADLQAYLIQNQRHYPQTAAIWAQRGREIVGTITRTAATGN